MRYRFAEFEPDTERVEFKAANPGFTPARIALAACHAATDRLDEARAEIEAVLEVKPDYTLAFARDVLPFKESDTLERFLELLRRAGLPA